MNKLKKKLKVQYTNFDWLIYGTIALFLIFSLTGCSLNLFPENTAGLSGTWEFTIPNGQHFTLKGRKDVRHKCDFQSYEVCFSDVYYNYDNQNQLDWNKMIGPKANYFKPHDLTIMNGWRVNSVDSTIQVNFYNHGIVNGTNQYVEISNGAKFTNTPEGYITIQNEGCFEVKREIYRNPSIVITSLYNPENQRTITDTVQTYKNFPLHYYFVMPYVGGQEAATDKFKFIINWDNEQN